MTRGEPSYTDLTYEVLKSAQRPLTFQEVFDEVNRRRAVDTGNPEGTIRHALGQGQQLVRLKDARYGYLPNLVKGSLLRQPLTEKPGSHPLIYSKELIHGLWPARFEIQKRQSSRAARLGLPNGAVIDLELEFLGRGRWGSPIPDGLRHYLVENKAAEGDSLLIRIVDGEEGRCDGWLEPRGKRDEAAIAGRNRELSDATYQILRQELVWATPSWKVAIRLLAGGAFLADIPPDPLRGILKADARFVEAGLLAWTLAESMTPERLADIQERKELQSHEFNSGEEDSDPGIDVDSSRTNYDKAKKTLSAIRALIEAKDPDARSEASGLLRELSLNRPFLTRREPSALKSAQELAYDAWEEPDRRRRISMARRALRISPDCADAYVILAEDMARGPEEAADLYAQGMAAGERALGAAFQTYAGQFWGFLESRPYMRARLGLAISLWELGRHLEAIQHLWEMLALNPNDNQGLRYLLLAWLLEIGQELQVEKLLNRYPHDTAGQWAYGRALHAFRTEGDTARARRVLSKANQRNPYAPDYLLGRKKLPRESPDRIGVGDESEAIACAEEQRVSWHNTPGALAWLDARSRRT